MKKTALVFFVMIILSSLAGNAQYPAFPFSNDPFSSTLTPNFGPFIYNPGTTVTVPSSTYEPSDPPTPQNYNSGSNSSSNSNGHKRCHYTGLNDKLHCGGNGRCSRCGGDGLMDAFGINNAQCSTCRGTGRCVSCNGTGWIN